MADMRRSLSISIAAGALVATAVAPGARAQLTDDQVPDLRSGRVNVTLEPPDRADQSFAATTNAVEKLYADNAQECLTPQLTVGQFVDATNGRDRLMQTLRRADQIGGPRWLDQQTCQIKLAIPGQQIATTLIGIAKDAGAKSPLPAEALAAKLKDWRTRTFIETGIAAARVERLRPSELPGSWRSVDQEERRRAVAAAKENAVHRVLDNLRGIEVAPGPTVADALSNKDFQQRFSQWLASRPVTGVEFRPDLFVELTLGVSRGELFDAFVNAARQTGAIKLPDDPQQLTELRDEFDRRAGEAIGRAHVAANNAMPMSATQVTPLILPTEPPDWVRRGTMLTGDASAPFRKTQLLTAQSAENKASDDLRSQVEMLPLDAQHTLGQAARQDPSIARAIDRSVSRARVYKIDYLADGGARVKMNLDVRDLWDELRDAAER
jgi:hypothetical protein